jgi:hypothetical protein
MNTDAILSKININIKLGDSKRTTKSAAETFLANSKKAFSLIQ